MRSSRYWLAGALLMAVSAGYADTLEMKDGKNLQGTFLGGTATAVSFKVEQGTLSVNKADILAIRFQPAAPAAAPAAAAPAAAGAAVPAGTVLTVRIVDPISSTSAGGTKFGFTVDKPVSIGSAVAIPAGTKGYGLVVDAKKAGRVAGKATLALTLVELQMGGRTLALQTTTLSDTGKGSAGKIAGGAALGATVGAITGNAGKGAAIGATAGAAKKGQQVGVPANALLEFTLTAQVLLP